MLRYKLRTLLLLLAILPPLLAVSWWKYSAWRAEQEQRKALQEAIAETRAREARLRLIGQLGSTQLSPAQAEAIQVERAATEEKLSLLRAAMQKLERGRE